MNPPIFIAIPAGNTELIEDMQRELGPYARVSDTSYRDPQTVKLIWDVAEQAVSIAGGVAGVLAYLQSRRDRARAAGSKTGVVLSKPGGPPIALDDADEALLKTLLGID